jgi:hypothetical protein
MMAKKQKPEVIKSPKCVRCGHMRHQHMSLNFADGPHVSGEVLVCPTAIYAKPIEVPHAD